MLLSRKAMLGGCDSCLFACLVERRSAMLSRDGCGPIDFRGIHVTDSAKEPREGSRSSTEIATWEP